MNWFTKKTGTSIFAVSTGLLFLVTGCGTPTQTAANSNTTNGTSGSHPNIGITSASKTIKIGYVNWAEDVATSYLWADILDQKGYHVKLKQLSIGSLFEGLSKGDLNLYFDAWLPITEEKYMKAWGSGLTDLGKWYTGNTNEGFVVPQYLTNINTMAELNAHRSEFSDKIVGIEPGAGETGLAEKAISAYGLKMHLQTSSTAAMLTALKRAYEAKQPIVVTLWSPHWAFAKYHLKYIQDPKHIFGTTGWIQTEANKQWANNAANATVVNWIKNFKLTPNQLGTLEEDMNHASSPAAGVQKWVFAHKSLVQSWLSK